MSKYVFSGVHRDTQIVIGWDRPLATFFVQVERPDPTEAGEIEILLWKGTHLRELPNAADAIAVAQKWARLPADLGARLETDRLKTLGLSDGEHQVEMKRRYFPG